MKRGSLITAVVAGMAGIAGLADVATISRRDTCIHMPLGRYRLPDSRAKPRRMGSAPKSRSKAKRLKRRSERKARARNHCK